ncbi:MAG TPA: hypothetical protein VJT81_14750, partial [Burkholderiales bacterium]|nr:hypothetical protein [Burkholderiales bacterium]
QFRDGTLTQDEARSLVLRIEGNLLGDLATRLPNDGIQRQITLRGDVDLRVQRLANGELRAKIDDIFVGSPTEARRAEFTQQLAAQYGFDHLTIRGIDANGNRIRVEFRADRGIVRNEARAGHRDRGEDHAAHRKDKKDRGKDDPKWAKHHNDRHDRADRRDNGLEDRVVSREHREDRAAKFIKVERVEGAERSGAVERSERQANFDRPERPERNMKFERPERPERAERVERPERAERAERPERPERVERAERVERPDRSGRH